MASFEYSRLSDAEKAAVRQGVKTLLVHVGDPAPATVDVKFGPDEITGVPTT